jgi:sec-independent protein translocase protein TatB
VGPISGGEFIVLLVLAAIVLGPERLPGYAQQLGRLVRELRRLAQGASAQVREELGPDFEEIDWKKLDPRQYDPRKIVRDALADDDWDDDDPFGFKALAKDVDTVIRDEPGATANGSSTNGSSTNGSSAKAAKSPASDPGITDDITRATDRPKVRPDGATRAGSRPARPAC